VRADRLFELDKAQTPVRQNCRATIGGLRFFVLVAFAIKGV